MNVCGLELCVCGSSVSFVCCFLFDVVCLMVGLFLMNIRESCSEQSSKYCHSPVIIQCQITRS